MYNVKDEETWGSKEKNNSVNNKTICLFLFSNAKQMAYVFAQSMKNLLKRKTSIHSFFQ